MGLSVLFAAAANALTFINLESIKGRLLRHVFEIPGGRMSPDRRDVFVDHKGKGGETNYKMIYNKERSIIRMVENVVQLFNVKERQTTSYIP